MAYIVQISPGSSTEKKEYEIVDNANHAAVNPEGALTLYKNRSTFEPIAIYQPGEWSVVRQDGAARRATTDQVFEALSVKSFEKHSK